jgi:hypothetical protein
MVALGWYGVGALGLIVLVFYWVRKIPAYVAACVAIAGGFAMTTCAVVDWKRPTEWVALVAGLLLSSFGLLIVRVMLVRSVSLQLLRRIEGANQDGFGEDIAGRLGDMRSFNLIRATKEGNALTGFGRLVSAVVAILYSLFRVKT